MKKIFKSALLLACGAFIFAACSDDNDSNPTVKVPASIELFTPALAETDIDLANSTGINLVCTYPDYGFPVLKTYSVEVSTDQNMSNAKTLSQTFGEPKMTIDAAELASILTTMEVEQGKLEADFPMVIPVYLRVRAAINAGGSALESTEVVSNVVSLKKVHLVFSLPPVNVPENLYITGNFCGWSWDSDKCFQMQRVWGARDGKNQSDVYWSLVFIDDAGIKFNSAKDWDGGEQGFANITIDGDLAGEIQNGDGNIASSAPKWYLMIVTASISGRDVKYNVTFNKAAIRLMGTVTPDAAWAEDEADDNRLFSIPETADGEFVSPAFSHDSSGDGGVRFYVKVPGYDWWKSEFIVLDNKIVFRGTGDDQERVEGTAGQKVYLNFAKGTGEIK